MYYYFFFFFSSRRRHTRLQGDWSSDVCSSDLFEFGVSHFADEFERDVKILWAYPLGLRRDGAKIADQPCEIFSHRRGNLQRDEEAHASGPFRAARRGFPAVVQEMDAHHIERELRGVPADRFAVAGEPHAAFFDAS